MADFRRGRSGVEPWGRYGCWPISLGARALRNAHPVPRVGRLRRLPQQWNADYASPVL
jgi:hypothetical protein